MQAPLIAGLPCPSLTDEWKRRQPCRIYLFRLIEFSPADAHISGWWVCLVTSCSHYPPEDAMAATVRIALDTSGKSLQDARSVFNHSPPPVLLGGLVALL